MERQPIAPLLPPPCSILMPTGSWHNHRLFASICGVVLLLVGFEGAFAQAAEQDATWKQQRMEMVEQEIVATGVSNPRVLESMRTTPRHEFMLPHWRSLAYQDAALPIGDRQTISPPSVVAYMTEQLDPQSTDRVLEIGTGSGYQAAVLSPLVEEVYTIEIKPHLGQEAERLLRRLGYENIQVRVGDGYMGWSEHAPFDKIIVTCSPESIPQPLVDQLAEGGTMIIPVGQSYQQNLVAATKVNGEMQLKQLRATLFVPMTGKAEELRETLPDPLHPQIANAGFEHTLENSFAPIGWYYLHQATTVEEPGNRFLRLENHTLGMPSLALQGMALDGRRVTRVRFGAKVRGQDLRIGPAAEGQPAAMVTCYDRRRAVVKQLALGPWEGSFDWQTEEKEFVVPPATREVIVRLVLQGATGRLDVDDLVLHGAAP